MKQELIERAEILRARPRTLYCIYNGVDTGEGMKLQIAKWGNSLALRIPVEFVRQIGLKEGDCVQANLTADGGLSIRPARWDRKAFAQELAGLREAMPTTEPVMDELRREARY